MQTSVAMTDIGRVRVVNQDYVYASDLPVGNLPNLYIVADGMGGHKAGDLASSYAVQTIVEGQHRTDFRGSLPGGRTGAKGRTDPGRSQKTSG